MRPLPLLVLVAVVAAVVAAAVAMLMSGSPAPPPSDLGARIELLEDEVAALRRRPPARSARRASEARDGATPPERAAPRPAPVERPDRPRYRPQDSAESADGTPRAFLDRYMRSFENDGKGSEFFRLAVEAFAPDLVSEMASIVTDPDQSQAARMQLASLLGAASFRGNASAVRALVDALRADPSDDLAKTAVAGLLRIGDRNTALELEAVAPFLERPGVRSQLYGAVATLAPDNANAALLRMLAREEAEWAQQAIVKSLNGVDEASALEAIRSASTMAVPVRNRAAEKLGSFRSADARRLLDDWVGRETDVGVRGRLTVARAAQDEVPKYAAQRMVGPADVANPAGDHENAWCPKTKNGGGEWILLTYAEPRVVTHVRVHQVYTPGAVVAVEVQDEYGTWHAAWEGRDDAPRAGVFEVKVRALDVRVKRVRVILDTTLHDGWHEIDAVEIVGPDGRAWAAEAAASSTWN